MHHSVTLYNGSLHTSDELVVMMNLMMWILRKEETVLTQMVTFAFLKWGPRGSTNKAEGCCPWQDLGKAGRRAAIFLVTLIFKILHALLLKGGPLKREQCMFV